LTASGPQEWRKYVIVLSHDLQRLLSRAAGVACGRQYLHPFSFPVMTALVKA
jgi:hypothetical protein